MTNRVAIYIDADNISSSYAETIISEAKKLGTIVSQQFFGDSETPRVAQWISTNERLDLNIEHVQVDIDNGKNSTDTAIAVTAGIDCGADTSDIFVIVSNDKDFVPVVKTISNLNKRLVGMVTGEPSVRFMKACHNFYFLDKIKKYDKFWSDAIQKEAERNKPTYVNHLEEIIDGHSDGNGWCNIGYAGKELRQRIPNFDCKEYGSKKFSDFLRNSNYFRLKKSAGGDFYVCKQKKKAA